MVAYRYRMGAASMETASRCSTEKEKGAHVFEISGYSLKKGMGVGKFVQSATFTVGGYDWSIRVYPDGLTAVTKEDVAFSLQFMSSNAEARAFYDLRLVKHGRLGRGSSMKEPIVGAAP